MFAAGVRRRVLPIPCMFSRSTTAGFLTAPGTSPGRGWNRVVPRVLPVLLVALTESVNWAQESAGGGVRVESSGRSFTFEAVVVAAFLGLALFSVCRSSRRV